MNSFVDWLFEKSGPIIRWRVANELMPGILPNQRDQLAHELISAPPVQAWLGRLTLEGLPVPLESLEERSLGWLGGRVHGSKDACLENVLGKLGEFGLRAGLPELDESALPLMHIFRWKANWKSDATYQNAWETLTKSVFAWGLLRLGYQPDDPMREYILAHLDICHKIARDQVYDIYADEEELVGLPKAWIGKPIIKQEVMANYWLPYIHDLYVFAHLPQGFLDADELRKLYELVRYILDPRFQALREGYGYAWIKERRTCYGWGWSPHLPGFKGFDFTSPYQAAGLVQRIELMTHFPAARVSTWFQNCLEYLESFRAKGGTYCFPASYLVEREGYYVSGSHMGLGQSPRNQLAREIESTFRMLKIKHLIN